MMKRILVAYVALYPALALSAEPRRITLDEALQRAGELSPEARVFALGVERARAEVGASGLWPNPEVSFVREEVAGVVERFSNLSQEVPWSGRLGLERAAARSGLEAAEASARQERVQLRARVREAFLDLLLAQGRVAALEAGRSRLDGLVEALRAREREGESSGFDRMRAERELAEVEADLFEGRGRLAAARARLASLVAWPAEGLEAIGGFEVPAALPSREEIRSLLEARGDLAALDAEAESAELQARAVRRRLVPEPTVALGTKSAQDGSLDETGPTLGIGFRLPVFDRGQGAGAGRAEAALLRARRASLVRLAEAEVEALHAEVLARREAERRYAGAGDPDDLLLIAWAAYEDGAMRIMELLDASRIALAVRLRTLDLHAAARRAEVALGRALGTEVTP